MNHTMTLYWNNTLTVKEMFQSLGYTVHVEPKSIFLLSQRLKFIGLLIDALLMIIALSNNKKQKFKTFFNNLLWSWTRTILAVAKAVVKIT